MLALSFARLAQYCHWCPNAMRSDPVIRTRSRASRCCLRSVSYEAWTGAVERLLTTRERMAISRSQDTKEHRYFRLRYDAVKRAGPTLWFGYCARWATRHEQVLLLMPKRKAGLFSTDDARRKTARVELERYERLRTTRVAACCEGKGGYFKKSVCRRT